MKKALIVVGILLVIAIGGFVYLAANANSLIAKYKPDLERIASNALDSHVTLGKLEASVFPSAKVTVDEFRISSSAEAKDGLTLKNLLLHLRLLPLLSGDLNIVKLSLDSPHITVIKDGDVTRIEGLSPKPAPAAAPPAATQSSAPAGRTGGPVPSGLGLNLEAFEIRDASLIYKELKTGKQYAINNVDVDASVDFGDNVVRIPSLQASAQALNKIQVAVNGKSINYGLGDGAFTVPELSVAVLDGRFNVSAQGNAKGGTGKASIASSGFELSKLALLSDIVPALQDLALTGKVSPTIDAEWGPGGTYSARGGIDLSSVSAKAGGIPVTNLNGRVGLDASQASQNIDAKDLKLSIGSEPATLAFSADIANQQATLSKLLLSAFGGTVDANGAFAMKEKRFNSQYTLSSIAIERALAVVKPELGSFITGTVEKVTGTITGIAGENLKQSLTGNTSVLVKNGALKGVNIAGDVLRAVKGLPFLSGSLMESAPGDKRSALDSADTSIRELSGNFNIADASLRTSDFRLLSALFALKANGSIGFDASLDLKSQIAFDPELSAAMVKKTPQLKSIQDAGGSLFIPLTLSGIPPKILVLPDLEQLARLAGEAALKQGAERLLDKVLKGDGQSGKKKGLGGLLGF